MTSEQRSIPDEVSDAPAKPDVVPAKASVRARFHRYACKISDSMSFAMLACPIVVLALPAPPRDVATPIGRPSASQSQVPAQNPAVAACMTDANGAAPAPPVRTRTIPVIDVKVRRETKPQQETPPGPPAANPVTTVAAPPIVPPVPPAAAGPAVEAAPPPPPPPTETQSPPPSPPPAWSEAEVTAALRACLTSLAPLHVEMEARPPVKEMACGIAAPIAISRIGHDRVELQPPAVVNCALAGALHDWLAKVAQPAARETFGSPIVKLSGTSGYSCRNRNGAASGPISEHAFGNALDVSAVVLADGRTIGVLKHWGPTAKDLKASAAPQVRPPTPAPGDTAAAPTPPVKRAARQNQTALLDTGKSRLGGPAIPTAVAAAGDAPAPAPAVSPEQAQQAAFLRRLHGGACGIFGTVLGPEANEAHRDHLHFDLKSRKRAGICQ